MDKKSVIMIGILVVIVIFYFPIMEELGLYNPAEPPPPPVDTTQQIDNQVVKPLEQVVDTQADIKIEPEVVQPLDSAVYDTIVVKTQKYSLVLSTFGGGPVSIKLNDYNYRDTNNIEMLPLATKATPEALFAGGTFSSSDVSYISSLQPGEYDATNQNFELTYTYTSPEGGQLIKKYIFYPDKYNYDLVFEINGREQLGFERKYNLRWNTPLGITEPQIEMDYQATEAVAMMSGERETLDDFKDNKLNQELTGSTEWAGVRSKYFAVVIIPRNRPADGVFAQGFKKEILIPDGSSVESRSITAGLEMPFANVSNVSDSFTVFVGPLDYNVMSDYNIGLDDILGIGTMPFVGWILKPFAIGLMWLLPIMYGFIPNYGLVIILVALLVKVVTLPLSMKSFKSMQAMKVLQPKLEELKKKHKKNPQELNKATMALYKENGVSPMSGCLPMLPQMPILFAMFSVFRQTILLRDAPFIWFIDDLSRGAQSFTDPYIILVVIMVIAQFLSQKVTMPSNQQNKALTYMMPLMIAFFFYSFSSGLILYYICFSLFSMLDYVLFKRDKAAQVKIS